MSVGWAWGRHRSLPTLGLTQGSLSLGHPSSAPHLQQEVPQGHKRGSVLRLVSPALDHDIVDVLGAVLGPRQALPFLVNLVQDLSGAQAEHSALHLPWSLQPRLHLPLLPLAARPALLSRSLAPTAGLGDDSRSQLFPAPISPS